MAWLIGEVSGRHGCLVQQHDNMAQIVLLSEPLLLPTPRPLKPACHCRSPAVRRSASPALLCTLPSDGGRQARFVCGW